MLPVQKQPVAYADGRAACQASRPAGLAGRDAVRWGHCTSDTTGCTRRTAGAARPAAGYDFSAESLCRAAHCARHGASRCCAGSRLDALLYHTPAHAVHAQECTSLGGLCERDSILQVPVHPHLKAALPTLSAADASCPNRQLPNRVVVGRAEAIFPKLGCAGLSSVSGPAAAGRAE